MNKGKQIAALTDSELALMKLFWRSDEPLTAKEIRKELYPSGTNSDHGTVQKLLQRLEGKNFISRDRSEFAHRFTSLVSEREYAGIEFQMLAEKLSGGSFVPVLTHLVESNGISQDELAELKRLFSTKRKK